ncbi:MAG: PilZ domain-containing protein [Gammaproteobacteria bacterium]|nr:PilZ domain-containing protein [Gammaproteobacteria bacterium]MCP5299221.1 PilZ domain-containing protein [Chromatiaceae bacterium]
MEQRSSGRRSMSLGAVVACPRFGLIRGQITDLGGGGLYVRAETSIVPIGAPVTVTFHPGEGICKGCVSLHGRVIHQSLHGFGIAFGDLDSECADALAGMAPGIAPAHRRAMPTLRAG